ncbi:MAG: uncharacterized membrane protein YheB (UPF0754 family) [Planctomycetota bacterium]|jgi:uncharacterized membrane protein YheB (UPF0754 family)
MDVNTTTWIVVPLLGGVIGYVTNRLAVKMIFRPIKPINILGVKIQGVIGRRQAELAKSIGRVVGDHLVQSDDIMKGMKNVDLEPLLTKAIDRGLESKVEQLRALPLIGSFLTPDRIDDLKGAIVKGMMGEKDAIFETMEKAVEDNLNIEDLVQEKVSAFSVERLESLVLEVANRELRMIEVLGGVLGILIGVAQVFIISSL